MVTIVVIWLLLVVDRRLMPERDRSCQQVQKPVSVAGAALRWNARAAMRMTIFLPFRSRFPVLSARRFVLVAMLALLSLVPARANPMLLVDMDTFDVLYAQEAGQPWHPASLTKLMTAYVAFEQIEPRSGLSRKRL